MNTKPELERIDKGEQSLELPGYPLKLLIIPAVVMLAELVSSLLLRSEQINYDCAYYLLCAGLLVDGSRPMTDFIDILPPIIFYLSLPSIWLSQLIHLPVSNCFSIITTACVCLSIVASIIVMRIAKAIELCDWLSLGPLLSGFLLFNLIIGFHFGQREHLFVLALFPIFLIRWLRIYAGRMPRINSSLSAACGLACAVAIFVKPQLGLIPLAVELAMFSAAKKKGIRIYLQPEVIFLTGGFISCFLLSFLIPGIDAYYGRWVPFVSKAYAAFFAPSPTILFLFVSPDGRMVGSRVAVVVLCLVAYVVRQHSPLIKPLLAWTLAGLLVYALQGRGWSYQSIPFVCGYFLLFCVVVANALTRTIVLLGTRNVFKEVLIRSIEDRTEITQGWHSKRLVRTASMVFLLSALVLTSTSFLLVRDSMVGGKILPTLDLTVKENSKPKDTIVILHTLFPHAHQMQLQLDRRPGCRYIWCFPLRMTEYLKGNSSNTALKNQAKETENLVINEIKVDIQTNKPKLIIIEAWADGAGFSLYKCLLGHGLLNLLSADYEPLSGEDGFAIYKRRERDYSQGTRERQNQ